MRIKNNSKNLACIEHSFQLILNALKKYCLECVDSQGQMKGHCSTSGIQRTGSPERWHPNKLSDFANETKTKTHAVWEHNKELSRKWGKVPEVRNMAFVSSTLEISMRKSKDRKVNHHDLWCSRLSNFPQKVIWLNTRHFACPDEQI